MNRKEAYEFCYENGARLMEIYNKDQLDLLITYLGKFISDRSRYICALAFKAQQIDFEGK